MMKKATNFLIVLIAYIAVVSVMLAYVEPYLPYVGLAVILVGAALLVKLYFSKKKFW